MHMADALLSPAVGGAFWLVSASLIGYSAKKITQENDSSRTPLMGVMGAFIFAAQMINFSIPGTGSSGHIGGGLLLAVLLGPYRAFITLASVLVIQCLFFADGGLMALGCNIFNLAFFPAFIAYPLIYKRIAGSENSPVRIAAASIITAETALLFGASSVVLQTVISGVTELPFKTFILFMIPIHAAIGLAEGLITFGVLSFVAKTEPSMLVDAEKAKLNKSVVTVFVIAAILTAGFVSLFASEDPDGLEWSMAKVTGTERFVSDISGQIHLFAASLQEKIAFLPDYSFKGQASVSDNSKIQGSMLSGTSLSGIIGSLIVLLITALAGFLLRNRFVRSQSDS